MSSPFVGIGRSLSAYVPGQIISAPSDTTVAYGYPSWSQLQAQSDAYRFAQYQGYAVGLSPDFATASVKCETCGGKWSEGAYADHKPWCNENVRWLDARIKEVSVKL